MYGHETGVNVLIQFAQVLTLFVRKGSDFCYRFGGDEFAVLITEIDKNGVSEIEISIEKRPAELLSEKLSEGVTASKGIVLLQQGEEYEHILRRADKAMYLAKQNRKL